jgi:hypothetical protein
VVDEIDVDERPTENSFGTEKSGYEAYWDLPPEVEAALRGVEAAFADARLSEDFDACPHCYTDHDREYLRTVPPREMFNSDIGEIVFCLVSTIGSARDIAYFLPSMLRLQLSGVAIDDAILMKRIGAIPAEHWTGERREALRAAFEAHFASRPAEGFLDLDDPSYRTWIAEALERPAHAAPRERLIAGWDY